jgi:hypothetical protein
MNFASEFSYIPTKLKQKKVAPKAKRDIKEEK